MSLVHPHAIIYDAFSLEAAELKGYDGSVFEHPFTTGRRSCRVLKNLTH